MTQIIRIRSIQLVGVVIVVAVTVAFAITHRSADAQTGPGPVPPRDGRAAADFFGVLRGEGRSATAADRRIGERAVASPGLPSLRADSVRTARTFKDGTAIRVIGGGSDYCLFKDQGQGVTCAKMNPGDETRGAPILVLGAGYDDPVQSTKFAALVGDGATDLRLTVEGGSVMALTPRNNVVAAEVPGRPLRLTWRDPDGSPDSLQFGAS